MKRVLFVFAILFTMPATAFDACDEAWFIRNLIFDRAGYCFGSPLGQATFDNGDCTGKTVTLSPVDQERVDAVKRFEADVGCAVNTNATQLDVPHAAWLRALEVLPIPSEYASGCMGWTGSQIALLAGPRDGARVAAFGNAGDDIVWEYDFYGVPEDWQFISLYIDGTLIGMGWTRVEIDERYCTAVAG